MEHKIRAPAASIVVSRISQKCGCVAGPAQVPIAGYLPQKLTGRSYVGKDDRPVDETGVPKIRTTLSPKLWINERS